MSRETESEDRLDIDEDRFEMDPSSEGFSKVGLTPSGQFPLLLVFLSDQFLLVFLGLRQSLRVKVKLSDCKSFFTSFEFEFISLFF